MPPYKLGFSVCARPDETAHITKEDILLRLPPKTNLKTVMLHGVYYDHLQNASPRVVTVEMQKGLDFINNVNFDDKVVARVVGPFESIAGRHASDGAVASRPEDTETLFSTFESVVTKQSDSTLRISRAAPFFFRLAPNADSEYIDRTPEAVATIIRSYAATVRKTDLSDGIDVAFSVVHVTDKDGPLLPHECVIFSFTIEMDVVPEAEIEEQEPEEQEEASSDV